jgi:P27 family predicted phage terminase small subunit
VWKVAGNPGKRALNKAEPDFGAVTNIDPPVWLIKEALHMWQRITPLLCAQKVLQFTDLHNLELFYMAYGRWREAQELLTREGLIVTDDKGNTKKHPAATIVNETSKQLATFGALLGLDPSSRQRLLGAQPNCSDNPFMLLLNGGK